MKPIVILLITLFTLVACTPTTDSPTPTPEFSGPVATWTSAPVATNTTEPIESTVTVGATTTPAPVPPTFTTVPTDEPANPADVTPTAVVDPAIISPAAIIIASPGNGSKVTSPILVTGVSNGSFEQSIVARLISADGTEIAVVPGQIAGEEMGQRGEYSITIDFEVNEVTPAFIQVFTDSPMDGGITTLSSVGIQLLPTADAGQEEIIENTDTGEHIVITSQANGDVVTGGSITIEGFGRPTFESTFVVEMTDSNGELLAREAVTVDAPMGQYGYFSVTFPYEVTEETPTRVSVRDISPAHGGDAFVNSILVRLAP